MRQREARFLEEAISNCSSCDVEEETLSKGRNLLVIVKKEDIVIKEIDFYLKENDILNLQRVIAIFR